MSMLRSGTDRLRAGRRLWNKGEGQDRTRPLLPVLPVAGDVPGELPGRPPMGVSRDRMFIVPPDHPLHRRVWSLSISP